MTFTLLNSTSRSDGVRICCNNLVIYECLRKLGQRRPERIELQRRLRIKLTDRSITAHPIDLDDPQTVEVLRNRKKVSLGELSVIVQDNHPKMGETVHFLTILFPAAFPESRCAVTGIIVEAHSCRQGFSCSSIGLMSGIKTDAGALANRSFR